jgi:hypothetical protein
MECYFATLDALQIDYVVLDSAEVFLVAATIVRDAWFSERCQQVEAADKVLAEIRSELSMPIIISQMTQEERLALRQRVFSANHWLVEKFAPHKAKRGPAVTAF